MKKFLIALMLISLSINVWSWDVGTANIIRDGEYQGGEIDSIPDPWTLPEITWEELEGQKYTILEESEDYIIIVIDGKMLILYK
jgi:hypothetical protein